MTSLRTSKNRDNPLGWRAQNRGNNRRIRTPVVQRVVVGQRVVMGQGCYVHCGHISTRRSGVITITSLEFDAYGAVRRLRWPANEAPDY